MSAIIEAKNLELYYKKTEPVIKSANFMINKGDFVFVVGESGSGKSTLLKSLYGALKIRGGELKVGGINMKAPSNSDILKLRKSIGIVFQDYKLIEEWNVEDNVKLPLQINEYSKEVCNQRTQKLLKHTNMAHKASKYPLELSGGEQQRVAMARALVHNPFLILADEPTGNLDEYSSSLVWKLLKGANEQLGITVLVVTHQIPSMLDIVSKKILIDDGVVYEVH
ncbi:ABC transporter ATP-binding protein [Helicobacter cholecystus]|uniref:ABC transporter ATP-binding protein n=1 Tax=Helicobacter cholecystus TaxID=45498 RepID=A0A3D8IV31_9HELI|nr:ABC transporter ATP-binding protein [Helicobacter cholecystus]RDU68836.1 ABC transporter ATP-binding protein [Helicobacter cholecystus]VEJ23884.1 cell division ATP-binding protein [Helicobacter cholecystus]